MDTAEKTRDAEPMTRRRNMVEITRKRRPTSQISPNWRLWSAMRAVSVYTRATLASRIDHGQPVSLQICKDATCFLQQSNSTAWRTGHVLLRYKRTVTKGTTKTTWMDARIRSSAALRRGTRIRERKRHPHKWDAAQTDRRGGKREGRGGRLGR